MCSNISGVLAINTIVSQTDIVVFLLQHAACGALGPLGGRSLEDLGLVIDPDTLQPRCAGCCSETRMLPCCLAADELTLLQCH